MLEKYLQKQILDYLRLRGVVCWKNANGSFRNRYWRKADESWQESFVKSGLPGSSDILGVLRGGRFIAVEVKAPGGKVSLLQKQFLDTINEAGGLAFVAHSIEEVEQQLNGRIGKNNKGSTGKLAA
jgi:hypothetical protein